MKTKPVKCRCGGVPEITTAVYFYVSCQCGKSVCRRSKKGAIEAWNKMQANANRCRVCLTGSFEEVKGTYSWNHKTLGELKLENVKYLKCQNCGEILIDYDLWHKIEKHESIKLIKNRI